MKVLLVSLLLAPAVSLAQIKIRPIEGGGGTSGVNVLPPATPEKTVVQTTVTALSPEREWKHRDGRAMTARLISFHDPEPGAKAPASASAIIVVQEGKVRLHRAGAIHVFPVDQLSEADQAFIKDKVDRLRRASAAEKKATEPAPSSPAQP